jgi:hypothetical protein
MDQQYLAIILKPISTCALYTPKMGSKKKDGYSLKEFQALYQADPFYNWFGLDNELMYAAHKAAGGMTSIYRQIGIGCETLFRCILQDTLRLSISDTKWSYQVPKDNGKLQTLSLDGRIPLDSIVDVAAKDRLRQWLEEKTAEMQVDPKITNSLNGIVFEVRQGYKSKDSKRQNGDIKNAGQAYLKAYLPCVLVLSAQMDSDIYNRYRIAGWAILVGSVGNVSPLTSTYSFMKDVVGYDLEAFFMRNHKRLHDEIEKVLIALLKPA